MKSVSKRDLSNKTFELSDDSTGGEMITTTIVSNVSGEESIATTSASTTKATDSEDKKDAALSDNISLFQSLRVLQEGEEGDDHSTAEAKSKKIYLLNTTSY